MPFHNYQHNFQVQPEKVKKLDDEICTPPFCSLCWDWWVKLVFVCAKYFVFHVLFLNQSFNKSIIHFIRELATKADNLLLCAKTYNVKTVLSSDRPIQFHQQFVLCRGPTQGISPSQELPAKPSLLHLNL